MLCINTRLYWAGWPWEPHLALNPLKSLRTLRTLGPLWALRSGDTLRNHKVEYRILGCPTVGHLGFRPWGAGNGCADADAVRAGGCTRASAHIAAGIAAILAGYTALLAGGAAAIRPESGGAAGVSENVHKQSPLYKVRTA